MANYKETTVNYDSQDRTDTQTWVWTSWDQVCHVHYAGGHCTTQKLRVYLYV